MSYDLYFLKATPGRTWSELYEDLEEDSEDLDPRTDLTRNIYRELQDIVPNLEMHMSEDSSELVDFEHKINLFVSGDEICLSTSLGSSTSGPEFESTLYKVAARIEHLTGRRCYDPQTDSLFLPPGL